MYSFHIKIYSHNIVVSLNKNFKCKARSTNILVVKLWKKTAQSLESSLYHDILNRQEAKKIKISHKISHHITVSLQKNKNFTYYTFSHHIRISIEKIKQVSQILTSHKNFIDSHVKRVYAHYMAGTRLG